MPQKLTARRLLLGISVVALFCAQTALAQQGSFIIEGMTPSQQPAPRAAPSFDRSPAPPRPLDLSRKPDSPLQPAPGAGVGTGLGATPGTDLVLGGGAGTRLVPSLGLQLAPGEGPDDSALRYYASLNQTARVQTEIRRLQRLYPGWEVPTDLYNQAKAGGEDEQALWDLFAADQLDDLRAAIDQRIRAEPGWQPSAELSQKLARKTVRNKIMGLYSAGKLQDLIDYVKNDGFNTEDTDIDVLWAVAETFAKSKQTQDAIQVYKSILTLNRESDVRVATIQKAMGSLRMNDVEPLIAMGNVSADGRSEFAAIQNDITRARISAFLHDERTAEIPAPELKAFEDYARSAKDPDQSGLVAWYYYKTKVFPEALEWFKLALERGGDAMIAHGLAHSLRELGMYRETEEVAYAWRQPLINNAILFIDILERDLTKEIPPYIEPERLFRYAQVTMDMASGEGAQGLAWYAYNSCQYDVAYEWFQRASAWLPKEATVYGLALSARKVKRQREFVELVNRYDGLFPKVVSLLFPDRITPPSPCDLLTASPKQRQQMMSTYYASQSGYQQQPFPGAPARPASGLRPTIGLPQQAYGGPQNYQQSYQPNYQTPAPQAPYSPWAMAPLPMPKLNPNEFPVAMNPENPLRFASTGKLMGKPMPIAASGVVTLTQMAPEYYRGPQPLVARRVPGVGPMPYERYGFTLLAGWNGTMTASDPHNAETAPAGTLWATDQAADARSTGGVSRGAGADGVRQDPEAAAAALGQLPRVPPPNAAMGNALQFMQMPAPAQQQGPGRQSRLRLDHSPVSTIETTSVAMSSPNMSSPNAKSSPNAFSPPTAQTLSLLAFLRPKPLLDGEPLPSAPSRAPLAKATDDLGREAAGHYNDKQYQAAIEVLDRRAETMPEPIDLRLIRGWALIKLGRDGDARRVFGNLDSKQPLASREFTAPSIIDEGSP